MASSARSRKRPVFTSDLSQLTGVYKNMNRGIVALVFRCEIAAGAARPTTEAAELAWLPPHELAARMSDAYLMRLLDALEQHAGPTVRAHDGTSILG